MKATVHPSMARLSSGRGLLEVSDDRQHPTEKTTNQEARKGAFLGLDECFIVDIKNEPSRAS